MMRTLTTRFTTITLGIYLLGAGWLAFHYYFPGSDPRDQPLLHVIVLIGLPMAGIASLVGIAMQASDERSRQTWLALFAWTLGTFVGGLLWILSWVV